MRKIKWKKLILLTALPLAVGALAAILIRSGTETFDILRKPPLSPPAWLFPAVWTLLYVLMGIASYLVCVSGASPARKQRALTVYGIQLAVNFFWPLLFFALEAYLLSFVWLVLLWLFILLTVVMFGYISETAGKLLIPYLLWVSFAGYLNLGIYLLN